MVKDEINDPREIEPGDSVTVDEYVDILEGEGFDAEYENLTNETTGYIAEVRVKDKETGEMLKHAVFDKRAGANCMMRSLERALEEFE